MATRIFAGRIARLLCATAAASMATIAGAQPAVGSPEVSNADVPALGYRSAFEGYRPFVDEKVGSWREANDTVGQVGGHAGIFGSQGGHAGHGAMPAAAGAAAGAAAEATTALPAAATGGQQTREAARQKVEQGSQQPHGHQGHGGSSGR